LSPFAVTSGGALISADAMVGAQRAAAVLLAMDKTSAQALLRHFAPGELREVTIAAARLGSVPHATLDVIVERFQQEFTDGAGLHGDEDHARELVGEAVTPDLVSSYLQSASDEGPIDVWKGLAGLPEKFLSEFLADEHPLVVTYILSRLDPQLTSRLVASLPREMRNAALCRLMAPPVLGEQALMVLEKGLRQVLLGGASGSGADEARARIADIINGLEPADAEDVMKALEVDRPQDAKAVRSMLFSFLDLPRLSQRARAQLFDKLTTDLVVVALRGTDAEFREAALSAMAARSRRLVEGELSAPSNAQPADIAKARKEVVKIVLTMAQKGELELPSNDFHDGMAAA
jgi:flagellar motor switch protein FliG